MQLQCCVSMSLNRTQTSLTPTQKRLDLARTQVVLSVMRSPQWQKWGHVGGRKREGKEAAEGWQKREGKEAAEGEHPIALEAGIETIEGAGGDGIQREWANMSEDMRAQCAGVNVLTRTVFLRTAEETTCTWNRLRVACTNEGY